MKLFNTNNIEIVKCCHQEFCFSLPSIALAHRAEIFFQSKLDSVIIFLAKDSCVCKILYFVTLSANRLSMYFSSHASLLVYLIAYAFGLLCFICCFLVKLYILFNRLMSTVLPSWWWIKMYILGSNVDYGLKIRPLTQSSVESCGSIVTEVHSTVLIYNLAFSVPSGI